MECGTEIKIDTSAFEYALEAVDAHCGGEFCRVIVSGFPEPEGESLMQKKQYMEEHLDYLRTALMYEPRGHRNMFGAFLCRPVHAEADTGAVFMDAGGYLNMCGHCTIGIVTVFLEAGLKEKKEGENTVVLDTPSGLIRTLAKVKNGRVVSVSLTNVPSFLYRDQLSLELHGRKLSYAISFGGSFFAMVDLKETGISEISQETIPELTELGMEIREKINATVSVRHPELDIHTVDLVEFYEPSPHPEKANLRNVVIFGDHMADHSPCGTGTSAKLAQLCAHGEIGIGQKLRNESYIGSVFSGMIERTTKIGSFDAVIPVIKGSAHLTGRATYLIDPQDEFRYGFRA